MRVYEPREDTFLLAKNLPIKKDDRVLEIGTGSGYIAIEAAKKARVLAVDINPEAVEYARRNAPENCEFRESDLFENVDGKFDVIIFNPPYLPVSDEDIAFSGGKNGREVIARFISKCGEYLKPGGRIAIIVSTLTGIGEVTDLFHSNGFKARIVAREKIAFEELAVIHAFR